ncbi:2'-5' RNA ligase [Arthrobacter sp. RIT-PI-e]|nr:2'-5' RNA ligase [Arthrobacter sp. RIT-PI-e]
MGVTITIPEPLAGALESWRASFGDPMATVVPPHITLITTTPASDWPAMAQHVRAVASRQHPFLVRLRSTGSFRPVSPVVYLKVDEGFDECVRLHEELQSGPLERAPEFPFHPHVTVAHDVSDAGMDAAEQQLETFRASFEVRSVGLYEQLPSGLWKQREEVHFGQVPDRSEAPAG